jgi:pilus assembly protein CpaB
MIIRIVLLALIGCGLAGFGVIVWTISPRADAPVAVAAPPPAPKVKLMVVVRSVRAGALLKTEDFGARDVDEDKQPEGAMADDAVMRRALTGGMIRRTMVSGDLVLKEDVLRPGDHGFLAAVLRPGFRAVTVAVDAVSGTAGLIWPGDRVDLILTQQLDEQGATNAGRRVAAETLLRDVRVIAIDQQLVQGATGAADSLPARTITLEVSSASAEQVQVATRLGRLSLAVRSAEHGPSEDKDGTTWASDVSNAYGNTVAKPVINTLKVFAGSGDGKEFKF